MGARYRRTMTVRPRGGRTRWRGVDATVAVVAHEDRSNELARLLRAYAGVFGRIRFIAPAPTARALAGIPIDVRTVTGAEGYGLGLAASIADGRVEALIFLASAGATGSLGLGPLLPACDLAGIPLATNVATAEILIRHLTSNPSRPLLRLVSVAGAAEDRSSAG